MKIFVETERLLLREILPTDIEGMYELDADPEVHRYLGNKPMSTKEQALEMINFIRQQYIDLGIGRWAIIDKKTNEFMGWSGLKYVNTEINNHKNFYDLGYRLIRKYWGQELQQNLLWRHWSMHLINSEQLKFMGWRNVKMLRQIRYW